MIKLQTVVALPPQPEPKLRHGMKLLSLGSCFSEHIGRRLAEEGFHIEINPFGIQYNPLSMARGLERLLSGKPYAVEELTPYDGLYHSFDHHGSYSASTPEAALGQMNATLERAASLLRQTDYLLLTWGTAYVYELIDEGRVVSNCHKLPEKLFHRRRCTHTELFLLWRGLLSHLFEVCPKLHLVQSVSPVRHLRDGAHANSLSKATLQIFAEELCEAFPDRVWYFPSYELMMDELRDYRFYAEDMLHPTGQAVRYIGDRFVDWAVDTEAKTVLPHINRLRREYQHRPLHTPHPEEELRREQLLVRLRAFVAQHPNVNLSSWLDPNDL